LAIYTTACIWIINQTLLRPQTIKSWIDKSGLYANLIPTLSDVLSNQETDTSIPLKDTGIVEAGRAAFTDKILKQTTEQAIDQVTAWLESKDGTLTINLNLSEPRTDFANGIGDYAAKRLTALPACTTVTTASFDAFETTCLPKGINAGAEGKRVANELLTNKSFLGTGIVTNKTLSLPEQSNEVYTAVPKLYQSRKAVFYASTVVSLLLSAAVVLLSSQRRKGVKRVARTYILLSIILFSSAFFCAVSYKKPQPGNSKYFRQGIRRSNRKARYYTDRKERRTRACH
jgi:hypothetical protein